MEELEHLREELRKSEQSPQKRLNLSLMRDELQEKINELTKEYDAALLSMHQKRNYDPETAELLSKQIAQKSELLQQLKEKIIATDFKLDALEEHSKEKIEEIQTRLIECILRIYPEQGPFYQEMKAKIETFKVR